MSILMFVLFGLIVGFLARAIMPGKQSMGFVATGLLGIAGALLGGIVGNLFSGVPLLSGLTHMHTAGFIGSILGALAVLALVMYAGKRRAFAT